MGNKSLFFSFAKSSNEFSDKILLGQFATSTIAIAVSLFEMSLVSLLLRSVNISKWFLKVDPLSGTSLSHLAYLSTMIFQVLLYCWYGNETEVKVSTIIVHIVLADFR